MNYEETQQYLERIAGSGIKLGLSNMRRLLQALGSPQDAVPAIHIAGSNGKGSVAAFLSSILTEAGYRVGLYTSPHLVSVEERIALDGRPITSDRFAAAADQVRRRLETALESGTIDREPTYFEFLTAMAFHVFQREKCDLQIVETGLGGRLDATNVIDKPLLCIITRIDREHMNHLGTTPEEIAVEKAGIVRPGVPTLTFERDRSTLVALRQAVEQGGSTLIEVPTERQVKFLENGEIDIKAGRTTFANLAIPLPGDHQIDNLSLALRAVELLGSRGYPVEMDRLRMGVELTRWPGRLEVVRTHPTLLLDGAHNPSGARCLDAYLQSMASGGDLLLVFGTMRDKDIAGVMKPLFPRARKVFLTRASVERAATLQTLEREAAAFDRETESFPQPGAALDAALGAADPDDTVLVTGSLILVGEIKQHLQSSS